MELRRITHAQFARSKVGKLLRSKPPATNPKSLPPAIPLAPQRAPSDSIEAQKSKLLARVRDEARSQILRPQQTVAFGFFLHSHHCHHETVIEQDIDGDSFDF